MRQSNWVTRFACSRPEAALQQARAIMLGVGVERLSGRLDQLSQRVGRLSEQLAAETAATRLARWASRHPPQSSFVRQIGEGNTGRCGASACCFLLS